MYIDVAWYKLRQHILKVLNNIIERFTKIIFETLFLHVIKSFTRYLFWVMEYNGGSLLAHWLLFDFHSRQKVFQTRSLMEITTNSRIFVASGSSTQPPICRCQCFICTSYTTGWPPSGGATSADPRWPPTSSLGEPPCLSSTRRTSRPSRTSSGRPTTGWPRRRWLKDEVVKCQKAWRQLLWAPVYRRWLPQAASAFESHQMAPFSQKEWVDSFCSFSFHLLKRIRCRSFCVWLFCEF